MVNVLLPQLSKQYLRRAALCLAGGKRTFQSFSEVHVWAWRGIYHQAREVARVLRPHYKVTVRLQARPEAPGACKKAPRGWAGLQRMAALCCHVQAEGGLFAHLVASRAQLRHSRSCLAPLPGTCHRHPMTCPSRTQGNEWQAPDTTQHGALFVILAAHLMPRFPPHYVVYQTEQWGHAVLAEGNCVWGPPHNGSARRDCAEVFRNAVEARPCSAQMPASQQCQCNQHKLSHLHGRLKGLHIFTAQGSGMRCGVQRHTLSSSWGSLISCAMETSVCCMICMESRRGSYSHYDAAVLKLTGAVRAGVGLQPAAGCAVAQASPG